MALDAERVPGKRTRTSSSKVRTGCVTCKIRHVKCDEGKPHCKRCLSTGRKCDGYALPKPSKAAMRHMMVFYVAPQQLPRTIMPLPQYSEVDHYHRHVAPKLSAYFDSPFWQTLILQMSHSEPAVRHAVSAITAIHRDMESSPLPIPGRPMLPNTVALKEIGEAMRSLSTRIQADPSSSLVPLVACLLFTCLECMRGNVDGAMQHMMSGFKVLNAARTPKEDRCKMTQSELDLIEEHIVPFFDRLNLLCISFGRTMPGIPDTHDMSVQFHSIDHARRNLYELGYHVVTFIRTNGPKAEAGLVDITHIIERTKFQRQYETWCSKMNEYMEVHAAKMTKSQRIAADLCWIHGRTLSVWLAVSLDADEYMLDQHSEDFKAILELAERIITAYGEGGSVGQPPKFSFEMGVIPALYYTAIKCRISQVRRKAVALLYRAPRREGLWNAHVAAKVAETIIELEEGWTATPDSPAERNTRIFSVGPASGQLPIEVVTNGELQSPMMDYSSTHFLSLAEACSSATLPATPDEEQQGTIEVVFRAKPWGLANEWTQWKQEVYL